MTKATLTTLALAASKAHERSREWKWIATGDGNTIAHLDNRVLSFATEKLARKAGFGMMDRVTAVKVGASYVLSGPAHWA